MEILVAQIHWLHLGQWQQGGYAADVMEQDVCEVKTIIQGGNIAEGTQTGGCEAKTVIQEKMEKAAYAAEELKRGGNETEGDKQKR